MPMSGHAVTMERGQVTVPPAPGSPHREPHEVHVAQWPGPGDATAPVIVCVHGLGGSHANWDLIAPRLSVHGPVWAPDLAGFGLTEPAGRRADLDENLDLLVGFVGAVSPERPAVLVGNSMGGLLSLMLAARHPELVAALALVNPALPAPRRWSVDPWVAGNFAAFMVPGVGETVLRRRARRLTPEEQVAETMRLCAADPDAIDPELLATHVEVVAARRSMPHAHPSFLQAARSIVRHLAVRPSQVWADIDAVQAPALLVHGGKDRLIRVGAARKVAQRRPDWTVRLYPDLGHVPMVEAPERLNEDLESWLLHDAWPDWARSA